MSGLKRCILFRYTQLWLTTDQLLLYSLRDIVGKLIQIGTECLLVFLFVFLQSQHLSSVFIGIIDIKV